jgi:hypothetical protein
MLSLPSMWSLIISIIVFFIVAWYMRRYLDELTIPKGMTRSILVFTFASLASWSAGEIVDWTQDRIVGSQPVTQTSGDHI